MKGVLPVRQQLVRSAATAVLWISVIEVVSSFAVKQLYHYDLSFTPFFVAAGILGLLLLLIARRF